MNLSLDGAGWSEESARVTLQQVLSKAAADGSFRELCLEDAGAAIKEISGRELPPGYVVRFVDNAGADLTIVLPDLAGSAELSDQDLEAVSGGVKCLVGSCGGTEVCGITSPCLSSKGEGSEA